MATKKLQPLPEETIVSLVELGEVLRPILKRMIAEGKAEVHDGKITILK